MTKTRNFVADSGVVVSRQGNGTFSAGIFLIDKPAGFSSFQIVRRVRYLLGIKKVGHAGTLDPFATGLLVVCGGRPATKLISSIMEGEKEYLATLRLGVETTTQDPEGEIISRKRVDELTVHQVEACFKQFRGEIRQIPPSYSALKHKGKPLYYYARKGIEIVKEPRLVTIKRLERTDGGKDLSGDTVDLKIRVVCSKGTYIRTLAADIGQTLGCGGYLIKLRRTRSGFFSVNNSIDGQLLFDENGLENLMSAYMPVEALLDKLEEETDSG